MNDGTDAANHETVVLAITAGTPGLDQLKLRLSPEFAEELENDLDQHDVRHGRTQEFADGPSLAIVAVAISAAGGLSGLAAALSAFFRRHRDKRVDFYPDGTVQSVSGMGPDQIVRILESAKLRQDAIDLNWAQVSARPGHEHLSTED